MDKMKGASNAGVFYGICDGCDGKMFRDYENENSYADHSSLQPVVASDLLCSGAGGGIVLFEIAIKNYLKYETVLIIFGWWRDDGCIGIEVYRWT